MSETQRESALTRKAILLAALVTIVTEGRASAYLDPGSVSFLFQAVIAGLLGGLLVLKRYWQQIKTGLSKLLSLKTKNDPD